MSNGSDDKARIGQHLGDIVKLGEGRAAAMRNDNERQFLADDRTILDPGERGFAELDLARRLGAGIPHRSFECRTVRIGRHLDEPETGGLGQRRRETESDRDVSKHQRTHRTVLLRRK
jgi:hypothetical protein